MSLTDLTTLAKYQAVINDDDVLKWQLLEQKHNNNNDNNDDANCLFVEEIENRPLLCTNSNPNKLISNNNDGFNLFNAFGSILKNIRSNKINKNHKKINKNKKLSIEPHVQQQTMDTNIEFKLNKWKYNKNQVTIKSIRILLINLYQILPNHLKWNKISIPQILKNKQLKQVYNKAICIVHPDNSIRRKDDDKTQKLCSAIFQTLEEAYNKHLLYH